MLIAVLAVGVMLFALFRYFVTNQIMDGGNVENPFLVEEEV